MYFTFRKNIYKIIIIFLICLLLAFLYLGNYNLIETFKKNLDTNNTTNDERLQANVTGNGGAGALGSSTMIGSADLNQKLAHQNKGLIPQ
jgi:uncharacterized protein YneF (UPF0154 family)